jgi:hypothetical protein
MAEFREIGKLCNRVEQTFGVSLAEAAILIRLLAGSEFRKEIIPGFLKGRLKEAGLIYYLPGDKLPTLTDEGREMAQKLAVYGRRRGHGGVRLNQGQEATTQTINH